jgi:hypothetical protein
VILGLNIVLCLDLLLTLRDPFKKPESRYNMYYFIVVSAAMVPSIVREIQFDESPAAYGFVVVVVFIIYVLIALYSAFAAYQALKRPGMSQTARMMIIRRHISYIIVNITCQLYTIISKF